MKTKSHSKLPSRALIYLMLLVCGAMTITAAPGDLDPTFGVGGKVIAGSGYIFDVAIQPDGKIVTVSSNIADFVVARYNQDGSPDTTFGFGTGKVITDLGREDIAWNIVIQPDGKIVAAGVSATNGAASFFIARYNSDGSFDTGFGGGTGKVLTALPCGDSNDNYGADFTIQPDGKLVGSVIFEYCIGQLIRYESDGSLDVSFGNHGFVTEPIGGPSYIGGSSLTSVLIQPNNGKLIWGFEYAGVYRYEPSGSPDLSFGSGGHVSCPFSHLRSVIIQPDGKIVALGSYPGSSALVRYNIDGSPDTSFGLNGLVTTPTGLYLGSAVIQPDGKIVAAGSSIGINGTSDFTLGRYTGDGSLDGTFGGGDGITTVDFNNSWDSASKVMLDSQGRAVVVGTSGGMFAIARFLADAPSPSCSSANPIDCADFFIRQQYLDFLGREPDADGFQNWMATLTGCGNGGYGEFDYPLCDRVHVSGGFVQSNEFQGRGYWLLRFGYVGLNRSIGAVRSSATYAEFTPALAQVGGSNSPAQEEAAKAAYTNAFVQRQDFLDLFPTTMTASQYVNALESNAQVTLSNKQALIDALNAGTMTRADVLRNVVESQVVFDKYIFPAFVTMEYFGYLRRDPDTIGYQNWVSTLESNPSNYRHMIFGFIYSTEYRSRFGAP